VARPLTPAQIASLDASAAHYVQNAGRYKIGLKRIDE